MGEWSRYGPGLTQQRKPRWRAAAGTESLIVDTYTWTVIPALPGTRIEWNASWCESGWVRVHAWLVEIDIMGAGPTKHRVDRSCVSGYPMVLDSGNQLADARFADLDGKPGEVFEP